MLSDREFSTLNPLGQMKISTSSHFFKSSQHYAFHAIFLGALAVGCWFQWGPQSHVIWDANCVIAFSLAATQMLVYTLRFLLQPAGWQPPTVWGAIFFAFNFAICLAEFRCGVPFYRDGWIFWIFLGMMLVSLPKGVSLTMGVVVTMLFVPFQVGWGQVGNLSPRNWLNLLYPLAFPWILGLLYRQLVDTNGERAVLIESLQAAKKELEAARDHEGELATLRERERLARELHDTLGHQLVTLTVQLEAAQRLLAVDPARAAEMMSDMQKLSRASMDDLRRALDNLRSSGLGEGSLGAALKRLCAEAGERSALAVDCQLAASTDTLPPAVAEVLWRVAQESLTNIGRHARARHARVSLSLAAREVVLQVADDGVGLPAGEEARPGHYGLRGLRERVEGLGGTFALAAPPKGGTVVEARLPLIS